MKNILKDRIFRNFISLFSGDAFSSLLSIFSITFITKGIGMEDYGFIVLLQGIAGLVDGVFNFQSWQGFIKFFPERRGDREKLEELIKFSYLQDIGTGVIAFLILNLLSFWIGKFYNFTEGQRVLLQIFSIYIVFNIQGTPIGILRSYDRFDMLRNQRIFTGVLNFSLLGAGYLLKMDLKYFLLSYLFTNVFGALLLNYFCFIELKHKKLLGFIGKKIKFDREFFKFNCFTNINSSLDIPVQYLDNLLVGKYLSLEELGIYKICKTVAMVLDKVGAPIYQVLYPFFCTELREGRKEAVYRKLFFISSLMAGGVVAMFIALNPLGFYVLSKFFGEVILKYKFQMNFYLLAKGLGIIFIGIHPLFLAEGFIKMETGIILVANGIYLVALFSLMKSFGLTGVIGAYLIQVMIIVILKSMVIFRSSKKFPNGIK